jgi:hypothetical protein
VRELLQLREENRKLKQLVADLSLDKHILREVFQTSDAAAAEAPRRSVAMGIEHGTRSHDLGFLGAIGGGSVPRGRFRGVGA